MSPYAHKMARDIRSSLTKITAKRHIVKLNKEKDISGEMLGSICLIGFVWDLPVNLAISFANKQFRE